jgi:spore maturation protein CgeB
MIFLFLTHSLVSDWNHGNAHFQRGVMRELIARGHRAIAAEPADGWSRSSLLADAGPAALADFAVRFPDLESHTYRSQADLEPLLAEADVVLVHEWTNPAIVAHLGRARARGARFTLLFHDTHHRAVSAPHELDAFDLDGYDAVLTFGAVLAEEYRRRGWARDVHVWDEAADTRLFHPVDAAPEADLVWIGNWGDGERTAELGEFLVEPVASLGLAATVHGVRYPDDALDRLARAGIRFAGRVANADVPARFAAHRVTVHVPRRPYADRLPGIPTIRVFEALACGIPLVSAPWDDAEGLFRPGTDYRVAPTGAAMTEQLHTLLSDPAEAAAVAAAGRDTVLARHTCAHRVEELLAILEPIREPALGAPA